MAVTTVVQYASLSDPVVIAPERYDPRRVQRLDGDTTTLAELVSIENPTISTGNLEADEQYLVLDTGDSFEGVIRPRSEPVSGSSIRSSKKLVRTGDVIISRLRPYLRQVAFVDPALETMASEILVSTEYFVLRPRVREESTAWLVPFLLSPEIQTVLGRSQEGGHHPRFTKQTLGDLQVPSALVDVKVEVSCSVEKHVNSIRQGYQGLHNLINTGLN